MLTTAQEVLFERATQFQGVDQQDAQELFSALLDALHEDLNTAKGRPTPQPTLEKAELDTLSAAERTETEWKRYVKTDNRCVGDFRPSSPGLRWSPALSPAGSAVSKRID